MKNTRKLVRCPSCEKEGKQEILGEIDNKGAFSVLRFHKGTTVILSDSFQVFCGKCGDLVFIRSSKK